MTRAVGTIRTRLCWALAAVVR